jgi:hypothetical protein
MRPLAFLLSLCFAASCFTTTLGAATMDHRARLSEVRAKWKTAHHRHRTKRHTRAHRAA